MLYHSQFHKFTHSMIWGVVDFNIKLRKILIGRNLTLRLLIWDRGN